MYNDIYHILSCWLNLIDNIIIILYSYSIYTYVGDHSGPYDIKMTLYHDAFLSNPVELDEEVPVSLSPCFPFS